MKKLQKLVLHKATIMTAPQMKHITGGNVTTQEEYCCGLWDIGSQEGGLSGGAAYGWAYGWDNFCDGFDTSRCEDN
jgi:hypothetical protein